MDRRSWLQSLVAFASAPWLPKVDPSEDYTSSTGTLLTVNHYRSVAPLDRNYYDCTSLPFDFFYDPDALQDGKILTKDAT